jgi:dTDP-4-amino-4,6-dideoxygalactose transaminase
MQARGFTAGMYPVAENVSNMTMALPFFTDMRDDEVFEVVKTFREALINA